MNCRHFSLFLYAEKWLFGLPLFYKKAVAKGERRPTHKQIFEMMEPIAGIYAASQQLFFNNAEYSPGDANAHYP
jgi:hypothetical protein